MAPPELDFQSIFEQSPDVLLVLRPDPPRYTMVAATRARLAITHTTAALTIGHGLFEVFPDNPDDSEATGTRNLRASLDRVIATRCPDTMAVQKYDIRRPDGTFEARYWSPKNLPVLGASGELLYILHRVEDVTPLVKASEQGEALRDRTHAMEREVLARSEELATANRELREANARLGELDAAKTAFFSNISHEFRTPLTLILAPLEDALADSGSPLDPAQTRRIALAHDNALRLLRLVTALLDLARLESGKMRAAFAPLDLSAFSREVAAMFEPSIARAGLEFTIACPPLSGPVWIDRTLWERVLSNLLSNAFKFTLSGGITIRLSETPTHAVTVVSDTGVGIAAHELPRLFERFHRIEGSARRTQEGTGIGLSLVSELVHLHGGKVSATSTHGRGTRFELRLRKGFSHLPADQVSHVTAAPQSLQAALAHATEAAHWAAGATAAGDPVTEAPPVADLMEGPPVHPGAANRSRRRPLVLVVDDNADLRQYVSGVIAPFYEVVTAADGLEALRHITQAPVSVVVSDVMMPNLDGFGLIRAIRSEPRTASLPIILMSARAGEDASLQGLSAGADDFLMKPFSGRELIARVRTHIELANMRQSFIAELERVQRELDTFSDSMSNQLGTTLHGLDDLRDVLADEFGHGLEPLARAYVGRIHDAVARVRRFVDSLVELADLSRAQVARDRADLAAIATRIVAGLRLRDPGRDVSVVIAPGLVATGDPRLLDALLTHLIDNAWKFTSRAADSRIEIGVRRALSPHDDPVYFVRDNGAGFDMAQANRLFSPFQRLHNAAEFGGAGLGLACAHRAVSRHRGRLWAESASGQGATFYFTLPDRDA